MSTFYKIKGNEEPMEFFINQEQDQALIQDIQRRVLVRLMHEPTLSFNQLWDKEGRSNKFAYHLKCLEQQELIKKTDQGYCLTSKGKQEVAYIDKKTGEVYTSPVIAVITVILKEEQVLLLHRKKEPFYGYWGIHGGKLRSQDYILEAAKNSIKEETGLVCDLEFKGIFSSKTYENDEIAYSHQLFIVKATNPKGEFKEESAKGENHWVKIDQITKHKILPNIPLLLEIAQSEHFRWVEANRHIKEGDVEEMDVCKDLVL